MGPTTDPSQPRAREVPKGPRLPELDSLRGIAALAVVVFHWTSYYDIAHGHSASMRLRFPWGGFGVHLFFVISGFVITMTLEKTPTIQAFLRARALRLYPTFWAGVVVGTLCAWWNRPEMRLSWSDVLLNFTMIPGFLGRPRVDGVYWTLELELVFYFAIAMFMARARDPQKLMPYFIAWTALAIGWYGLLSALTGGDPSSSAWHTDHPIFSWFTNLLLARFIGLFAAGVSLYGLFRGARLRPATLVLAALCIANQFCWGRRGGTAALMCSVAMVAVACFVRPSWLRWRPLLFLGMLSYPIYLIHQNLGFATITTGYEHGLPPYGSLALALALTLSIAYGMRRLVEEPAIAAGRSTTRKPHE